MTDQDLREEFTRHYGREQSEYRLRHILVPGEQAARAALAQLGQGRGFEDVARSASLDDSAARGGDLGWRRPEGLPAPIAALLADPARAGRRCAVILSGGNVDRDVYRDVLAGA